MDSGLETGCYREQLREALPLLVAKWEPLMSPRPLVLLVNLADAAQPHAIAHVEQQAAGAAGSSAAFRLSYGYIFPALAESRISTKCFLSAPGMSAASPISS